MRGSPSAHAPRRSRPHPFAIRFSPAGSTRFQPLMRRSGWVLPLRQAVGSGASVDDSEAPFRCPRGTARRGERRLGGPDLACDPSDICVGASAALLRAAAQRRQGPGSSDRRFGTLRGCLRMAVRMRQVCGRLSAAKPLGSRLSCGDLDGCCLCAELRGWWRPWPTAKRHVGVRVGRPFAASGAWVVRTWRAIRATCMRVRPLRCGEPPRSGGKVRDHRIDDS